MKIVGVNMDNLDNNLGMVTKGQQQQPEQPRRMLQILYIGGIRNFRMKWICLLCQFSSLVIFAFFKYRLIPRFDLTMFSSDK